uniref:Uncharacterized protein n=1 Tax=Arundo donax TaxID=35708 RepID=A0A0A8XR34_ARUDO
MQTGQTPRTVDCGTKNFFCSIAVAVTVLASGSRSRFLSTEKIGQRPMLRANALPLPPSSISCSNSARKISCPYTPVLLPYCCYLHATKIQRRVWLPGLYSTRLIWCVESRREG